MTFSAPFKFIMGESINCISSYHKLISILDNKVVMSFPTRRAARGPTAPTYGGMDVPYSEFAFTDSINLKPGNLWILPHAEVIAIGIHKSERKISIPLIQGQPGVRKIIVTKT